MGQHHVTRNSLLRLRRAAAMLVMAALAFTGLAVAATSRASADSLPWISIGDATQVRPTSGTVSFAFAVKLSHPVQDTVSVAYYTVDGSARSTNDYNPTSGTLTFAPGQTSQTVKVTVLASTLPTGNRVFYVDLANAVAGSSNQIQIQHNQGTGTIIDPTTAVYLNSSDATTTQGSGSASTAVFTLSLSAASANPISVQYTTQNGNALAGTDYTYTHGTANFPPGTTTQTVSVPVTAFSYYQAQKYFYLNLSNAANALIGDNQGEALVYSSDHTAYITADDLTVNEPASGMATVNVPVHLGAAAPFPVTVSYQTSNGSAVAGTDYQTTSGTLTIPAGTVSVNVPVTVDASSVTSTKYFALNLSQPSAGAYVWRSPAYVTIVGTSSYHQLQLGDVSVVSPASGTTNATFTVTLSPASSSTVTVNYQTADGSATTPTQYTAESGTLTFSANQSSKTVNVPVKADSLAFSDAYFYLELSSPSSGTTVDRNSAYGLIEASQVQPLISVSTPVVQKPASGTTTETFNATLSSASPNAVTVNYSTSNNSAVAGTDYTATSGQLTFPAGTTTEAVNVPILSTTLPSTGDLNYVLSLSLPSNPTAQLPNDQGSVLGWIQNPNRYPTLSISNMAVYKPQSGTTPAKVTVTLSPASPSTVTATYQTSNNSATAGTDYAAASGTVTFPPGATSESISVNVDGNTLPTGDRNFYVSLSSPTNATLVSSFAQVDIVDSSIEPVLSLTSTSVAKPSSSGTNAVFTVTLSPPSPNAVSVNYATSDGSAQAGRDYTAESTTLNFPAGSSSETVSVPIIASTVHTGDRYFYLSLTSPVTNAVIGNQYYAEAEITDPTVNPALTVDDAVVVRPASGTTTLTFNVHEYPATTNAVTVNYTTVDGSATAGTDYVAKSGQLIFSSGATTESVQVTVDGGASSLPDRYFYLSLSTPTNAQIIRSSGQAEIVSPTSGTSYLTVSDAAVAKPNSGTATETFTVSLLPAATTPVYVNYATIDQSATAGEGDYVATRGTLTFAAGTTSKTVSVTVNGNDLAPGDRWFYMQLSNPSGATTNFIRSSSYGYILNAQSDNWSWVGPSVQVNRGDTGSQTVILPVTLSAPQTYPVSVDYYTTNGSAISPDGYVGTSGTLNFPPGQTVKTVPITIPANPNFAGQQDFTFNINDPVNTTVNSPFPEYVYIDNLDTFTVGGTVVDPSGNPVAGVTVTRTGNDQPTVSTLTGSNGSFSFPNTIDGIYKLTPTLSGETFQPPNVSVTVRGAAPASTPFIAITGKGIEGKVADTAGKALAGATVTLSGAGSGTTTTDALGYYAFGSLASATGYVVTPAKAMYSFNPGSYTANITTATVKNEDFVAVQGISITGQVTATGGTGVSGVTITRSGGGQATTTVKTNSEGYYGFSNDPASAGGTTYTITPSLSGSTFTPSSASATVTSTTSASGVNFTQN